VFNVTHEAQASPSINPSGKRFPLGVRFLGYFSSRRITMTKIFATQRQIRWSTLTRWSLRLIWALSVLVARLMLILAARFVCLLLGIMFQDPVKKSNEKTVSVPKPQVVYLKKTDPHFATKRDRLKTEGYRWHSGLQAWTLTRPTYQRLAADPKAAQ
jgi:hypothetical protein